ncbi:MAG TPA: glycosyltransferase family 39 protein [Spirillospora sp.]|nr:glycosyltransferase family 39 protein [Spirillospora sp.]
MAVSQTARAALLNRHILTILALLTIFGIASAGLQRDSLWFDEAYTLYIVRDDDQPPENLTGRVRFVVDSLRRAVERARADVHPPLYFAFFDIWSLLAGESVYAARLPSTLAGLIGLAATYTLGRRLFDHRTGLIAVLILGTAGGFLYYNREARMYLLLLALAALATLAYLRWRKQPTLRRTVLYGGLLAALPYTHYAGALIALTHAIHLLLTQPRRFGRFALPGGLALLLFAPWIPSLVWQLNTHGGPAAPPFTQPDAAVAALIFYLTGGYWGIYIAPFVPGSALPRARQYSDALALLLLWLLLTPAGLLLLDAWIPSLFQVRYTLAILPAGALLVAYATSWVGTFDAVRFSRQAALAAQIGLLALLVYTQLTIYPYVWPPKSRWDEAARQMAEARHPLEPAITAIPAHSPAAYYDRQYGIRQGIALDLAWRWQEPADIQRYVEHLSRAASVWVVMPSTYASAWDAARALLADRRIGYRDSVMDMLFYRLDKSGGDDLRFQFGDLLEYRGGIQHQLYAHPGEDFCFRLSLTALADIAGKHHANFYLTQGYNTLRAETTVDLGPHPAGAIIDLAPCIPVPADTPAGPHHLRLRIHNPESGQSLPLLEHGDLYWGDVLIFALVHVG